MTSSKELKKRKLGSMNGTPAVKHKTEHVDDWELSEEDDIGDQSAALLQGFESSSDEEEGSDGDEAEGLSEVPAIPANQELAKKLQAASATEDEAPGVIYVG